MGYLNIPANGWPQLNDLEKLDKIAQQMENLPTFTSDDRAFLEALPAMPTEEGKTVLTAITDDQGDTELTYETPEVESADIAPTFLESVTYSAGTLVYYDGILYKFTEDHAAGAWDPSEVTPTSAAAEFVEANAAIDELKNTLTNLFITGHTNLAWNDYEGKLTKEILGITNCKYYIWNLHSGTWESIIFTSSVDEDCIGVRAWTKTTPNAEQISLKRTGSLEIYWEGIYLGRSI